MRKIILLIFCLFIGGVLMSNAIDKVSIFTLTSDELKNNSVLPNAQVYNGYGCKGENVSPQLSWNNAPDNTKSFALICHDPDAPRPNGWYHWLVVNIPKNIQDDLQTIVYLYSASKIFNTQFVKIRYVAIEKLEYKDVEFKNIAYYKERIDKIISRYYDIV